MCENQSEYIEKPIVEHHVSKPLVSDTYIQDHEIATKGEIKKG